MLDLPYLDKLVGRLMQALDSGLFPTLCVGSQVAGLQRHGQGPSIEVRAAARQLGLTEEPLAAEILSTVHRLPYAPDHRDPFGRLLVWQAICRRHTLLNRDRAVSFFKAHGLSADW